MSPRIRRILSNLARDAACATILITACLIIMRLAVPALAPLAKGL